MARGISGAGSGFRVGVVHSQRSVISVFQEFSPIIGKAFVLVVGWALVYHSMGFRQCSDIS